MIAMFGRVVEGKHLELQQKQSISKDNKCLLRYLWTTKVKFTVAQVNKIKLLSLS